MANCYKTKEKEDRRNKLYSFLRKNPGKEFSWKQLSPVLGVKYAAVMRDMDALVEEYEAVSRTSMGIMYKGDLIMEEKDRYPITKNNEGYSDPTAAATLIKEQKEEAKQESRKEIANPKAGEVWHVTRSDGRDDDILLVLAVDTDKGFATCCPYCIKSVSTPSEYNRLFTKPLKYFRMKAWGMPLSVMIETRNALRDYFEIDPELIEVEKIVEKPVTVEKVVESQVPGDKLYSQIEMDAAIAKCKAEVYEECFKALARR